MTDLDAAFKRYNEQRKTSRRRGIRFLFEFEEWVAWWEAKLGLDWQVKRGCRKGQYVMARKGDKGPYKPSNVDCLLTEENCAQTRGELVGTSKLTEKKVKAIYSMKGTLEDVAKKFGISFHTVWDIKSGRYWRHVTKDLGAAFLRKAIKLTNDQVIQIYKSKLPYKELVKKFGVGRTTIYDIWSRNRWGDVTSHLSR